MNENNYIKLMSLIDDIKEKITDGEYLNICNALKEIKESEDENLDISFTFETVLTELNNSLLSDINSINININDELGTSNIRVFPTIQE